MFLQNELRCRGCGKLLAKGDVEKNFLEIKCVRCGVLNKIFEQLTDQIIITDKEGTILFVNKQVERITGYSTHEVIGQNPSIWGGQMSKDFYKEMWRILLEEKSGFVTRVLNKQKDGTSYEALLRISPVMDAQGDIVFFVGMETKIQKNDAHAPVQLGEIRKV